MLMLVPNAIGFNRLNSSFRRGADFKDELGVISNHVGQMMVQQAQARLASASAVHVDPRSTSVGMSHEVKEMAHGHEITLKSAWEGYPRGRGSGDGVGDAARAAREGWATMAHRIEFGYPSSRSPRKFNPRAGRNSPHQFMIPAWEFGRKQYMKMVQDALRSILKGV